MLLITMLLGAFAAAAAKGLRDCDCVRIEECEQAFERVTWDKSDETIKLVNKAYCGPIRGSIKVCCSDFNLRSRFQSDSQDEIENHPNSHLLLSECGNVEGSRITGGTDALLFEFPWLTLISYKSVVFVLDVKETSIERYVRANHRHPRDLNLRDGEKLTFGCDGTVINSRYVLTAAHCIKGKNIAGVRVGDYDISKKDACIDRNKIHCELKHQDLSVLKTIIHPGFDTYPRMINDIGLLRLRKAVDFTLRNARPICLPIYRRFREMDITHENATVAGWGATESQTKSDTLQKATLPILPHGTCKTFYDWNPNPEHYRNPLNNTLCAGGKDQDTCKGDSGGPLMLIQKKHEESYKIFQFGIVSYGMNSCKANAIPGIYTDVRKYMKWILDTIEP